MVIRIILLIVQIVFLVEILIIRKQHNPYNPKKGMICIIRSIIRIITRIISIVWTMQTIHIIHIIPYRWVPIWCALIQSWKKKCFFGLGMFRRRPLIRRSCFVLVDNHHTVVEFCRGRPGDICWIHFLDILMPCSSKNRSELVSKIVDCVCEVPYPHIPFLKLNVQIDNLECADRRLLFWSCIIQIICNYSYCCKNLQ